MDNKASPVEERALTNAIERAATVASINESLDRNQLLAEQLKKASVDKRFAKTASAAFNKRLTVLIFKKTADEHKTDNFQLTDADTVYNLVAGETPEVKEAAAAPFTMGIENNEAGFIEKSASISVKNQPVLWEHRVAPEVVEKHITSLLEKHASLFRKKRDEFGKKEEAYTKKASEVAAHFHDTEYDFDFTTAVNLHGDKLENALKGHVPEYIQFTKTSKYAVHPDKDIFKKVAALIEDKEALEEDKKFLEDYATSLAEFSKSAAMFGTAMHMAKFAATAPNVPMPRAPQNLPAPVMPAGLNVPINQIALAQQNYSNAQNAAALAAQRVQQAEHNYDLNRPSYADQYGGLTAGYLGAAVPDVLTGGAASLLAAATNMNKVIYDAGAATLSNAYNMYQSGLGSVHPADVLDADFLTRERYHDRMMAWSDMTADPQFSAYPAEQVWDAVNKAMNLDMSLERPDRREVLRAYVGQLLAQNNRVTTADVAALAQTIRGLEASEGNAAALAAAGGEALADKEHKPLPELKDPLAGVKTDKLEEFARQRMEGAAAAEKDYVAGVRDLNKEVMDSLKGERDTARAEQTKADATAERAREKLLDTAVRAQEQHAEDVRRQQEAHQRAIDTAAERQLQIDYRNELARERWDATLQDRVVRAMGGHIAQRTPNGSPFVADAQGNFIMSMHDLETAVQNAAASQAQLDAYNMPPRP